MKCLYNEGDVKKSTLYKLLEKSDDYDEIILVGGYLYDKLTETINMSEYDKFRKRITLVYNEYYDSFGSGYSLISGIMAVKNDADSVTFVEGDLLFDNESFNLVTSSNKNIITYNLEQITADKSVICYITVDNKIAYNYDVNHEALKISAPFKAIYNSAQIWKFNDISKLKTCVNQLHPTHVLNGNGLELITKYMNMCETNEIEFIKIKQWENCNTVANYINAIENI